jgi:hypothetical protein
MSENEILEKIFSYCKQVGEKKILNCARAFQLSKEIGVDIKVIGQLCHNHDIKLKHCQLGCF